MWAYIKSWVLSHQILTALCLALCLGLAVASLATYWSGATSRQSAPEVAVNAASRAVTTAVDTVKETRVTNDEAIRKAYVDAKLEVANLSADAVVSELNLLLDELRGGSANRQ